VPKVLREGILAEPPDQQTFSDDVTFIVQVLRSLDSVAVHKKRLLRKKLAVSGGSVAANVSAPATDHFLPWTTSFVFPIICAIQRHALQSYLAVYLKLLD
jgi:hypothetical protein